MPPAFPLLLLAPALLMDWVAQTLLPHDREALQAFLRPASSRPPDQFKGAPQTYGGQRRREWCCAVVCGLAFAGAFLPTQWFFSEFLLSPHANNWCFAGGGRHWPYFLKIDQARTLFWGTKEDPVSWTTPLFSLLLATGSAWLGLCASKGLNRLRR